MLQNRRGPALFTAFTLKQRTVPILVHYGRAAGRDGPGGRVLWRQSNHVLPGWSGQ